MVTAARVAGRFGLDPLDVLARSETDYALLVAAARVLARDEQRKPSK